MIRSISTSKDGNYQERGHRPGTGFTCGSNRRSRARVVMIPLLVCLLGCSMAAHAGDDAKPSRTPDVEIEPKRWKGARLPVMDQIDIRETVERGTWTLVFFRHDCPDCLTLERRLVAEYEGEGRLADLAFVEVPPYGVGPRADGLPLRGRLSDARSWDLTTPIIVRVQDGKVEEVESPRPPRDHGEARTHAKEPASPTHDPSVKDLGFIELGSIHRVEFPVDAPGTDRFAVRKVISDCACTDVTESPQVIEPGTPARLVAEFHAPEDPMTYSRRITLLPENSKQSKIELIIRARVGLPLWIQPESVRVQADAGSETSVVVHNGGPAPVKLLYATSDTRGVVARVPSEAILPGEGRRVTIRIPQTAPIGTQTVSLSIRTSCPTQRVLAVPVRWDSPETEATGGGKPVHLPSVH